MQATFEERTEHTSDIPRESRRQGIDDTPQNLGFTPEVRRPSAALLFEGSHVWVASSLFGFATFIVRPHLSLFHLDPKTEFLTKVIDVAAIFTAYALTALTVLPALNDRVAVQRLRRFDQYQVFCKYVGTGLYSSGWLILYGLFLKLGFDRISSHTIWLAPALSSLWWASCSFALLALFRASRLLLKLVISV